MELIFNLNSSWLLLALASFGLLLRLLAFTCFGLLSYARKTPKKLRKTQENAEKHGKKRKSSKKPPSERTLGVPWARLVRSEALLEPFWEAVGGS